MYQFFLSNTGSDNNDGKNVMTPFKTFNKLLNRVTEIRRENNSLINVMFVDKEYKLEEPIQMNSSHSNIYFSSADQNSPTTISGGIEISNWERDSDRSYLVKSKVSDNFYFESIWVNNEERHRARHPFFYRTHSLVGVFQEYIEEKKYFENTYFLDPDDIKIISQLTTEDINNLVIRFFVKWDTEIEHIHELNQDEGYVKTYGISNFSRASAPILVSTTKYILENSIIFLDSIKSKGMWYLDNNTHYLYYFPYDGECDDRDKLQQFKVTIPLIQDSNPITIRNTENVTFRNIKFKFCGLTIPLPSGYNPTQSGSGITYSYLYIDRSSNIHFENIEISHHSLHCIYFYYCNNCSITHSLFEYFGISGIRMNYCTYMKIDNNIIRYGGQWVEQGCGILFQQGSYVNITHNDISNLYYTGISIGWVWGYSKTQTHHNLLLYNHIHHLGFQLLSDMGGIYHLGIDEGTHLSNNWIHNVDSSSYGGWGLYTDEGSSHVTLENNLVYNTSDGSFHQHYGNNNTVQNNIFAFSKSYILMGSRIEDHLSFISNKNILYYDKDELFSSLLYDESYQVTMDNNIYWNPLIKNATFNKQSFETYKNKYNRDKNSFVINPLFVNPENYDFHFRNEESIQKISFNKFEYTDAGVYGDNEWIQKANDYIVHEMFGYKPQLSLIDNFDRINKPIYYNLEGTKGYTYVTNKKSYSGTYSLALDSSTSSSLSIPPYFAYTVPSLSGNKTFSCWINAPKEAVLYIQVRDNSSPFVSSPSIRISNGNLLIGTGASQKTIEFIPDQWFKIYMNVGFGKYRTQNITLGAEINGNKTEVSQELNENFNLQKTMVFANTAALNYTVYFDDFYDVLETDEDEVENVPMPTPYVAPELVKGFISGMVLVCSIVVVIVVLIIVILIKRNK